MEQNIIMTITEYKEIEKIRTEEYKNLLIETNKYFALFGTNNANIELYYDFWSFNIFIEEFEMKVIKSQGKQKENGIQHLKTLYDMQKFNSLVFARFNYENVLYKAKAKRLQKEQFIFLDKIKELQERIDVLEKMNKF